MGDLIAGLRAVGQYRTVRVRDDFRFPERFRRVSSCTLPRFHVNWLTEINGSYEPAVQIYLQHDVSGPDNYYR